VSTQFYLSRGEISEYCEDRSPSNPQRTDNNMQDDRKKDERSENW